jgi:hypothetical protein
MNAAVIEVPPALRHLVDSRLDAIERALLQGDTPRAERRSILEDIETQIVEMLSAEAPDHEPTRADLLRVFTRLDPPEAFAGEPLESVRPMRTTRAPAPAAANAPPATQSGYATTGILACVGGLTMLLLGLPLCAFTMLFSQSQNLLVIAIGLVAVTGIPSLVLGILYAVAIHNSHGRPGGQLRGLTCAAIGIAALPISIVGLLGGYLVAVSESDFLIIGSFVMLCVLAVVGVIHLTYRSLELLVGAPRRPA